MGPPRGAPRATGGILLDTNILVYYQLPSQVAVDEQDKIISRIASSIIDNLDECGPLIVVDALIDEMKNALRDKLIERGISREAKTKSASKLVEDFREILESVRRPPRLLMFSNDFWCLGGRFITLLPGAPHRGSAAGLGTPGSPPRLLLSKSYTPFGAIALKGTWK